ncbi:nuclear transport factor 2 family protein [Corynebacterium guangdongense]|uniref:DUF4440 domain-containing protein n=1 Tax=Corynebacterium guangdongense TaxID=1783348 RepID=A0ABU1ZYV4_9CORY|nr:nuclear transport factor 2 family protein [Corynebacterium guangdongense]MDR7330105.1 hypothetical protein [Corynebacterium guangdongense]WJZ18663.1 hypothetical protein CGUA_10545 [Corynebacterium guangdongense]
MDSELEHVLHLERELQTPSVRRDRERLTELLHPDFVEFGASGRRWDRDAMLDDVERDRRVIHIKKLEARTLAEDLIQVFWQSKINEHRARRSSLWKRTGGTWRIIHHQATPLT